jgi:hypothetical protein
MTTNIEKLAEEINALFEDSLLSGYGFGQSE